MPDTWDFTGYLPRIPLICRPNKLKKNIMKPIIRSCRHLVLLCSALILASGCTKVEEDIIVIEKINYLTFDGEEVELSEQWSIAHDYGCENPIETLNYCNRNLVLVDSDRKYMLFIILYTVDSNNLVLGQFFPKQSSNQNEFWKAAFLDKLSGDVRRAYFVDGSIGIRPQGNGVFDINFDFKTNQGKICKGNFTGKLNIVFWG
jgi:hypothetical protein